eukprot:CAMPEP_0170380986 /NCGR_PEP_ID=MMETSP0117_2-20130122/14169_1 /TAXON_ID=400756 /ORGANISM="Durinskia baltica, Strain CSIRO CS-38" /LENGTH=313 /DNA_ID=CAMNT_0010636529 /DNA_START=112 /DNA_END=1053 /DNA_ORIENTATION=-
MDLGAMSNWTLTSWPTDAEDYIGQPPLAPWKPKIGVVGITANWFGDDKYGFPSLFADSLNEQGLSCSLLALNVAGYEEKSDTKTNVFAGLFCFYVAQNYGNVYDLKDALPGIAIWGPDALSQHFIVHDASGASLIVEVVGGKQHVYLDTNSGVDGNVGVFTNEPTFDWHQQNIEHYEWKRTLARQAIAVPGNFYPEDRFLRAYMMKSGMQDMGLMDADFQEAFSLTVQVMNTVTVPQGNQYGTDSGSGEGSGDHSCWGLVRDHKEPALYWRDATNPTFRKIRVQDVLSNHGPRKRALKMETGPFFIDMTTEMR